MGWILSKYWIVGCIQWIVQVWNFCHMCPHHFDNPPNYVVVVLVVVVELVVVVLLVVLVPIVVLVVVIAIVYL